MTSKGLSNIQGCSGIVLVTTSLASHNNFQLSLFFIRHDERCGFQAIAWWIYNFVQWFHRYLTFVWPICLSALTSAWYSIDELRRETQNFLILNFNSLICLSFITFSYSVNKLTLSFLVQPRELQSFSRLTTCSGSTFFISSLLEVNSSILAAQQQFWL